ncbi:hypothetical protein [Halomicrococcus sp. SG-WS-1]|uniref:hypothetical protein n=1 Tax=Halomicrococcus sp. SG-WS-1 TaxID=3439057 RepID=UPI003F7A0019
MSDPAPDPADLERRLDDVQRTVNRLRAVVAVLVVIVLLPLLAAVDDGLGNVSLVVPAALAVGAVALAYALTSLTA